jgi:hypothetical protein
LSLIGRGRIFERTIRGVVTGRTRSLKGKRTPRQDFDKTRFSSKVTTTILELGGLTHNA